LLSLGDNIAADLTTSISQFGLIDGCSEFDYLGAAHGWAGLLYSLLRWAKATNRPASQQCVDRSWELASLAEPKARGFRWPGRVRSPNVTPAFMPGWCNGSAGFTYLWTLNYRLTGDSRFLELAEKAAWNVWEQSDGHKSLCCGLAGRAYSLLNVWKWTGEPRWLDRARNQVVGILRESKSENPFRHSLYKGDVGIALVAYEIENPEFAMMPMFE
jgi:serine/threonine-protein kinase